MSPPCQPLSVLGKTYVTAERATWLWRVLAGTSYPRVFERQLEKIGCKIKFFSSQFLAFLPPEDILN
jgi:hypothetical protein